MSISQTRVEIQSLAGVTDRSIHFSGIQLNLCQGNVCSDKGRVVLYRREEFLLCPLKILALKVSEAKEIPPKWGCRACSNKPLKIHDRFRSFFLCEQDAAFKQLSFEICWILLQCFVSKLIGLRQILLAQKNVRQVSFSEKIFRVFYSEFLQSRSRLIELPSL